MVIQELFGQTASLSLRIDDLEAGMASQSNDGNGSASLTTSKLTSGGITFDIDILFASIIDKFEHALHIVFRDGGIQTVKGIFQNVEVRQGVTIHDRITGDLYCIGIENGQTVTTTGGCDQQPTASPNPMVTPAPSVTPEPSVSAEPTPMPESTPEPTVTPVSEIIPEASPSSAESSGGEAQLEATPTPQSTPTPIQEVAI